MAGVGTSTCEKCLALIAKNSPHRVELRSLLCSLVACNNPALSEIFTIDARKISQIMQLVKFHSQRFHQRADRRISHCSVPGPAVRNQQTNRKCRSLGSDAEGHETI